MKINLSDFGAEWDNAVRTLALKSQDILYEQVVQEIRDRGLIAEEHLVTSFDRVPINLDVDPILIQVQSDDIAANVAEYGSNPSQYTDKKGRPIVNPFAIQTWLEAKGDDAGIGKAYAIALKIGEHGLPLHGGLLRPIAHAKQKAQRKIYNLWQAEFPQFFNRPQTTKRV